jgi:hypothetical protein
VNRQKRERVRDADDNRGKEREIGATIIISNGVQ